MARTSKPPITCRWFVADDVREEIRGKVTLVGVYPDATVRLEMPPNAPDPTMEQPVGIEGLAVLCSLSGVKGRATFELAFRGADPAKVSIRKFAIESERADVTLNFISRFRPLLIQSFGDKVFTLTSTGLGFKEEFKFTLKRAQMGEPPPKGRIEVLPDPVPRRRAAPAKSSAVAKNAAVTKKRSPAKKKKT